MLDAGIVADPIVLEEDDLRRFTPGELYQLEATVFLPGITVYRLDGPHPPRIEIRADRPCVTTLPARAR